MHRSPVIHVPDRAHVLDRCLKRLAALQGNLCLSIMHQTEVGSIGTKQTDICKTAAGCLIGHNGVGVIYLCGPVDPGAKQRPQPTWVAA